MIFLLFWSQAARDRIYYVLTESKTRKIHLKNERLKALNPEYKEKRPYLLNICASF